MISRRLTVGEYRFDSRLFSDVPGACHGLNCESLLISRLGVTLDLFERLVSGPRCDFARAATGIGQPRATGRPESMECAALRQSRFVAPCAKLCAKLDGGVGAARLFHQERKMLARCRVDDSAQLRNHGQRQLRAGLIL